MFENNCEIIGSSYELLGYSQSFLGVLLTIFLICLFHGKNNLIEMTLKEIIECAIKQQKNFQYTKNDRYVSEQERIVYKIVDYYKDTEHSINYENLLKKYLYNKIKFTKDYAVCNYNITKKLDEYKKYYKTEEAICGISYSIYFIITIFCIDGFLKSNFIGYSQYILTELYLFTIYSFVFLSTVWIMFFRKKVKKEECKYHYFSQLYIRDGSFFIFILLFVYLHCYWEV